MGTPSLFMGIDRKGVLLGVLRGKKVVLIMFTLFLEFGWRYFQNYMIKLRVSMGGIAARKF